MELATDNAEWVPEEDQEIPTDFPTPILWRLLIAPVRPKKQTKSGIVIPIQGQAIQEHMNYVGKIVACGDIAWTSPRFKGQNNFPKVGDYVVYGRYAGQKLEHKGFKFLIVNDDEVLGLVTDPESLKVYI